jgi:hypothetical protein
VLFVLSIVLGLLLTNFLGLYGVFMITTVSLFLFWVSSLFVAYFVWDKNLTQVIDFGK